MDHVFQDKIEDVRVFLEKAAGISAKPDKRKRNAKKPPKGQADANKEKKNEKEALRVQRFRNVFAKPIEMIPDFVAPVHDKTATQRVALDEALADNFIFLNLDKKSRAALVDAMEPIKVPKGHMIIKQGDMGDYFYVIEKGMVVFLVDGKTVGKGEAGRAFGELALLYDCPRAATVICETDCQLWRVDQLTVRKMKAARAIENKNEARDLTRKVSFLKNLTEDHKNRIADALEKKYFAKGDFLAQKGTPCKSFIIIQEGTVRASDISAGETRFEDLTLGPGEVFGQKLVESGTPWIGNATAITNGSAYSMSRENFLKLLGGRNLDALIAQSRDKHLLLAIPIFAETDLDPREVELIQELIVEKGYKKGHVFSTAGEPVTEPAIYIVRTGAITVKKQFRGADKVLGDSEVFGDQQLLPPAFRKKLVAKHTITCTEDATLGVLTLEAIASVVLDIARLGKEPSKNAMLDESITLDSLKKYKILGAGTFGQVWLVSVKDKKVAGSFAKDAASSKIPYALKIQYKRDLIGYNQVEGVINEKNIMEELDHPFVISLINTYKDELRVYMLMQLLQGGELFCVIHTDDYDGVPEEEAVFYAAGVLEGLSYMHRRKILHRDLKGENVLMDSDGYCVLIDLGFAKHVPDKTYTCCGTPTFMAPEVLLGEGHNHGADLWSLGVLIYDMIVGYTPFYIPGMTQMQLYEGIVRAKFSFPDDVEVSSEAKNLIRNLLFPDPSFRLGCLTRGDLDIRGHPWFSGVDFGKLYRKELEAPWVPQIKDPFDVSQFDDWSELENEKKDRKPLSKKEKKLFDDF